MTGSVNLRARWYQPGYATLLGVDPALDRIGDPYLYAGDNPINGSDPSGLCYVSTFFGTYNVPPLDDHRNCSDVIGGEVGQIASGINTALLRFNSSDLSTTVVAELEGTVSASEVALAQAQVCAQDAVDCARLGLALAQYVTNHPQEVLDSAVAAQVANVNQLGLDVRCGRYGAVAGELLVGFVLTFGPAKLGDLLREVRAGKGVDRLFAPRRTVRDTARGAGEGDENAFAGIDQGKYEPQEPRHGQSKEYTCVAACCVMTTCHLGKKLEEAELAEALGTTVQGASLADAPAALAKKGVPGTEYRSGLDIAALESALRSGHPAIVGVRVHFSHAVVVDKIVDGQVFIRDPLPLDEGSAYSISVRDFTYFWKHTAVVIP